MPTIYTYINQITQEFWVDQHFYSSDWTSEHGGSLSEFIRYLFSELKGIKSDIESSEGIWYSSDIYLTPFWQIKDRT